MDDPRSRTAHKTASKSSKNLGKIIEKKKKRIKKNIFFVYACNLPSHNDV